MVPTIGPVDLQRKKKLLTILPLYFSASTLVWSSADPRSIEKQRWPTAGLLAVEGSLSHFLHHIHQPGR